MEIRIDTQGSDEPTVWLEAPLVRLLWEGMSDGALAIDAKSRQVVAMNGRARELLGYELDDVMGCQCRKLMNSPACVVSCPLTALLEGRKEDGQLSLYYRGRSGASLLHAHTRMLLVRDADGAPLLGIELFRDLREVQALQKALKARRSLVGLVGQSAPMQRLYQLIEQLAPYDIPVLLSGESGVGKERVAEALQQLSSRADGPFVKVNCAALSPTLVESELFGHRKGAFTGACRHRRGYIEEADGGTLLLDEVGELPLSLQAKLLRFLQEGEVQRLGEEQIRKVDVRVLAATNRSLDAAIAAGQFREDLYYRLLGAHVQIPPLRERREDIPLLTRHMLAQFAQEQRLIHPGFRAATPTPKAMARLVAYHWPGNVRQLAHVLRLASIQAQETGEIGPSLLALEGFVAQDDGPTPSPGKSAGEASDEPILSLAEVERQAIARALAHTDGNLSAAARLLGIDRSTLWRKQRRD